MGKKSLFVLLVVLLGAIAFLFLRHKEAPLRPVGAHLTKQMLLSDSKIIGSRWLTHSGTIVLPYAEQDLDESEAPISLSGDVLRIQGITRSNKKLNHVYAAMDAMLYLSRRELPSPLSGVVVSTHRRFVMDGSWPVGIGFPEFKEMLQSYTNNNMTDKQIVDALAEQWIQKHQYEGWFDSTLKQK